MGVRVVGFLLFSVVVYWSPWCTLVLGCFSQHTWHTGMCQSGTFLCKMQKRDAMWSASLALQVKTLKKVKPTLLRMVNSVHKAVTCRLAARHLESGWFSPLLFQIKYLHVFLQLLCLLKIKGDAGWPQANTSLRKHLLYRTVGSWHHLITTIFLYTRYEKPAVPLLQSWKTAIHLVCGKSFC